jgi:hypothetical protein
MLVPFASGAAGVCSPDTYCNSSAHTPVDYNTVQPANNFEIARIGVDMHIVVEIVPDTAFAAAVHTAAFGDHIPYRQSGPGDHAWPGTGDIRVGIGAGI